MTHYFITFVINTFMNALNNVILLMARNKTLKKLISTEKDLFHLILKFIGFKVLPNQNFMDFEAKNGYLCSKRSFRFSF